MLGVERPLGDPTAMGVARRAVVEAREGDPTRFESAWEAVEKLPDGMGRALEESCGMALEDDMVGRLESEQAK